MKTIINSASIFFQSIITVCILIAFGISQNTISIEVDDGSIDVLYNSDVDIGGFQFAVEGATVTGASGGDAAANGFTVQCSSTTCLGFSFTGSTIPPGSGSLVIISADITGDVSLTGIVVSNATGEAQDFSFVGNDGTGWNQSYDGCVDDPDWETVWARMYRATPHSIFILADNDKGKIMGFRYLYSRIMIREKLWDCVLLDWTLPQKMLYQTYYKS